MLLTPMGRDVKVPEAEERLIMNNLNLSEWLDILREVVAPSIPLFIVAFLGWGIFPKKMWHPHQGVVVDNPLDTSEDSHLVPLGPQSGAELRKMEKIRRTKGRFAAEQSIGAHNRTVSRPVRKEKR